MNFGPSVVVFAAGVALVREDIRRAGVMGKFFDLPN